MRAMPSMASARAQQRAEVGVAVAIGVHRLPEEDDLAVALRRRRRAPASSTAAAGTLRSRPRTYGTMQKVQNLSQPRMIVIQARTPAARCGAMSA